MKRLFTEVWTALREPVKDSNVHRDEHHKTLLPPQRLKGQGEGAALPELSEAGRQGEGLPNWRCCCTGRPRTNFSLFCPSVSCPHSTGTQRTKSLSQAFCRSQTPGHRRDEEGLVSTVPLIHFLSYRRRF